MLAGFLTLLGFQLIGEFLQRAFDLPLPGQVIGMLLLFIALMIRGSVPAQLEKGSQHLIDILPMLLMAPAAGVFFLGAGFADQWPGFIAAISAGTILTLIFCGLLLKFLTRRKRVNR
ncbi:CidA/LrgA family protein [Spongiibacter sp. KMU-158]|uniref:CidA/LrgA family protein n=1 Tax=Spongiibacter pelagi TaxID=2760804 RepID=A0A927C0Q6_9GAMM|nr:CidA/LrgA family protein [Spongiibacter pelagi]MBD2857661.1 CidA/LrgA family protein [Spongiibacter pelagi]